MKVLGIQSGHNSSVALYKNNKLVYYNQEERLSRLKKDCSIPILCLNQLKNIVSKIDVVLMTSYNPCVITNQISNLLIKLKIIKKEIPTFYLFKAHHLMHATKAYFSSKFKKALVFVVDGQGSSYNLSDGSIGYETASVYTIDYPNDFNAIYKRIYTQQEDINSLKVNPDFEFPLSYKIQNVSISKNTEFEITNQHTLAHFYSAISRTLGFDKEEGKLMGLSAYGKENITIRNYLNEKSVIDNITFLLKKEINISSKEDLSYETQVKFEKDYLDLIKPFIEKFNNYKNIILTGGTGLNILNNRKIKNYFKNHNIYVDPMCGDEGNSIGACQHYLYRMTKDHSFNKTDSLYLGPSYNVNLKEKNKIVDENYIVKLLLDKKIIALYQDKAEAGPRALGNRSLLMDPRIKSGKYIMNKIKGREQFRPLACCVLEEYAKDWFDLDYSPYMMYSAHAINSTHEIVPSIVHKDNTCRIQTINKKQNPILYKILKLFYKKTKVPMLMNTSFNLKGEPIVETPEDAINTFKKSKINYLYFSKDKKLIWKLK
jgi:carbamoyltransferase